VGTAVPTPKTPENPKEPTMMLYWEKTPEEPTIKFWYTCQREDHDPQDVFSIIGARNVI
jgi:hypothetical protein